VNKVVALIVSVFLAFMLLFAVLIATGHAMPTKDRPNSIGADVIYTNPYSYRLVLPIDGQVWEGKYTSIRFWPYGTPELYDESLLFCGDVSSTFNGRKGVLVLTFRTQASHLYKGVACHELISVFEVPTE